ncbi:hypothetical protein TWF694_010598 [Orbilia ellipsospora]|uniref:Myb-like domain-containing protein n=1 Tax=Orbilia ellipsospora TaxID=2528407 RepID=A0AAV9XAV5_9PEZI
MVSTRRQAYKNTRETATTNEQAKLARKPAAKPEEAKASQKSPKKKAAKSSNNKKNKSKPINAADTITAGKEADMVDTPTIEPTNDQGASEPEQTELQLQSSVTAEIGVSSKPDASDADDEENQHSDDANNVRENGNGKQERTALRTASKPKTKKRKLQAPTKRKKDADNQDGFDDETEDESTLLEDMTLEEFRDRFSFRAKSMEGALTLAYDDLLLHRKSVEKRLRVVDTVLFEDIQEFNVNGIYDTVFRDHPKYRVHYQSLPAILPGDPFPSSSDKFDETDPRVQALFPDDDRRVYEIGVFKKHLQSLDSSLRSANNLLKAAEKIFTMARGYKATLERQSKWAETFCAHASTVKETYLEKRIEERDRIINMKEQERGKPVPMQNAIPVRPTASTTGVYPTTAPMNRKRKLDPTAPEARRQKQRHQAYARLVLSPNHDLSMALPMEVESESGVPDTRTREAPVTPPPAERIIIEGFGDHTPGRTRRYKNANVPDNTDAETMKDGILIDTRPWTEDENSYLDFAMSRYTKVPGRWLDIKENFGRAGQPLASRSASELQARAQECKAIIAPSGITLPEYWDNLDW